jgi:hypothetical protein
LFSQLEMTQEGGTSDVRVFAHEDHGDGEKFQLRRDSMHDNAMRFLPPPTAATHRKNVLSASPFPCSGDELNDQGSVGVAVGNLQSSQSAADLSQAAVDLTTSQRMLRRNDEEKHPLRGGEV